MRVQIPVDADGKAPVTSLWAKENGITVLLVPANASWKPISTPQVHEVDVDESEDAWKDALSSGLVVAVGPAPEAD